MAIRIFSNALIRAALALVLLLGAMLLTGFDRRAQAELESNLILVNSTNDPGDGVCDPAECTLREAINNSNASPNVKNTIAFNIPGAGVRSIKVKSALPQLTDPLIIDGYTQPGAKPNTLAVGNNAVLMIELTRPKKAATADDALVIKGGSRAIKGLIINRFSGPSFPAALRLSMLGGNIVAGNFIGTNAAGTAAHPNSKGILVLSNGNTIGGASPADRNLISGNRHVGLDVEATGTQIYGNYIGTDLHGAAKIPNGCEAIYIHGGVNTIGGTSSTKRNVISGNGDNLCEIPVYAIELNSGSNSYIIGNWIGVKATGKGNLGNAGMGIALRFGSFNNTITRNRIANNAAGIVVGDVTDNIPKNNSILRNSIFDNGNSALGIDLGKNGVDVNDAEDPDTGPNRKQNWPYVTKVLAGNSGTKIKGTIISTPNTDYLIQFFRNPTCNTPGGYGEGRKFVGEVLVHQGPLQNALFTLNTSKVLKVGEFVTATATNQSTGDTSEFSKCKVVKAAP
jgi:CSLREA domain-containing protein